MVDGLIGYDTESYLISPGRLIPRTVCGTFSGYGAPPEVFEQRGAVVQRHNRVWQAAVPRWELVQVFQALDERGHTFVAHNAPYDMVAVGQVQVEEEYDETILHNVIKGRYRWTDTKVREMLIAIAGAWRDYDPVLKQKPAKFKLKDLVARRFGIEIAKGEDTWRLRYGLLDGLHPRDYPAEALEYAMEDARWALEVHAAQQEKANLVEGLVGPPAHGIPTITNEWAQCRADVALFLAGARGAWTDEASVDAFESDTSAKMDEMTRILQKIGCAKLEKGQWKTSQTKLREYTAAAYARQGQPAPKTDESKKFPNGQVKISSEALSESGDENLVKLGDLSEYKTWANTFVPLVRRGIHTPINPGYNILVDSGRVSSYEPNLTNMPRKGPARSCFKPRPGYVFCSTDYSIAELRALAQILLWEFGWSKLADVIKAGQDPHISVAAILMGVDYSVAAAAKADRRHPLHKQLKAMRNLAKALNFGLPGGLGAASFMAFAWANYEVDLTLEEAQTLSRRWKGEMVPEIRLYFRGVSELCEMGGGYTTIEQYVSKRIRGKCMYTQACNSPFQGLVADFAKDALVRIQEAAWTDRRSPLYGSRPIFFVHDEVISEVPEECAHEAAYEQARIMAETAEEYTPDVPMIVEPALMRRWYKDADPVIGPDGRLVPWEPDAAAA